MVSDRIVSGFSSLAGRALLAFAMLATGCNAPSSGSDKSTGDESAVESGKQTLAGSGKTLSSALQSVSLSVKNELTIDRSAEYVTSGIPIPRSWNAASTTLLNIVDTNGATVASQFEVSARWGGVPSDASKPIKWVLATFLADVPASSSGQYALVYGAANETASSLLATDSPSTLIIDTGTTRFTVNKTNFSLFESVTVNGVVATQSTQNGLALTAADGTLYTSANGAPASVTVEESGPVRVVVRVAGSMRNSDASPLTDYTAYLYFYAGKSYARVIHTIGNHNKAAVRDSGGYYVFNYYDPNSITFNELSSRIDLYQPSGTLSYLIPGSDGNKSGIVADIKAYQDSSGTEYWDRYASASNNPRLNSYVKFRGYKTTNGDAVVDSGNHYAGWMDVSDEDKGVTVGIQGFWQNFPKALSATAAGTVSSNIFPKDFGSAYNFRVGEEKSTEMFYFFHSGTGTAANADRVASGLASPMMALAPPEWYTETGAVQEFTSNPDTIENRFGQWNSTDEFTRYNYYNDRALIADPGYSNIYYYTFHSLWQSTPGHPSSIDYFEMHGWPWHGNQPLEQESFGNGQSGPFNVKYNLDHGAWIHFLRSGDYRWKGLAEASSKHLEALMLHDVITETGWDVYAWKDAVFGHEQHGDSGNGNSVRNPLGPVADTAYGGRGAVLHYFLTGYPPSKRFAASAADYAYNWFGARTIAQYPSYAPSREAANVLSYLDEGLRLTGDLKYQRAIHSLLTEFASSKMSWIDGPVPGSEVGLPVWIFGDYYTAIARYAQLCKEFELGADCDFAEHELLAYLDWHKTYATRTPSGWTSTYYYYNVNGNNDPNDVNMVNNWSLLMADALAYGYAVSGDQDYLDMAGQYYRTGVWNPFYPDSPLIYSASKEAVNHMTYGHVFMYYATHAVAPPVDSIKPEVSIASPAPNATLSSTVIFQVDVSDNVGVAKVTYALDGEDIGTVFTAPFNLSFNTTSKANGTHTLTARAYDAAGNLNTSQPITFTILNILIDTTPPVCSLTNPLSGTVLSGTVSLQASVTDNVGVSSVRFLMNGKAVGPILTSPPYQYELDTTRYRKGSYTISARAIDSSGNIGACPKTQVRIFNYKQTAPVPGLR